eukprot:COSAG06_NODE_56926_length_282_cov_1.125683_1_plen_45_part_01
MSLSGNIEWCTSPKKDSMGDDDDASCCRMPRLLPELELSTHSVLN